MIKAIVFDIGGVITKGRFSICIAQNIASYYGLPFEKVWGYYIKHETQYLLGKESQHHFLRKMAYHFKFPFNYKTISNLFLNPIKINNETLAIIKRLYKKYDCHIASDNYKEMEEYLMEKKGLQQYFKICLFSNRLGIMKNSTTFFAKIKKQYPPATCVFIDDRDNPIKIAKKVGFHTIKFENAIQLKKELRKLDIQI